ALELRREGTPVDLPVAVHVVSDDERVGAIREIGDHELALPVLDGTHAPDDGAIVGGKGLLPVVEPEPKTTLAGLEPDDLHPDLSPVLGERRRGEKAAQRPYSDRPARDAHRPLPSSPRHGTVSSLPSSLDEPDASGASTPRRATGRSPAPRGRAHIPLGG